MSNEALKSIRQLSDESEQLEIRFDRLVSGESGESGREALITEIVDWLRPCAEQGRYIPPASAERQALRSILERWRSRLRDQGVYAGDVQRLEEFDPQAGFALDAPCPYPGLEPYSQNQRESFFGRKATIESCVDHLDQQGNRILLIIGASGSGKSSLAMAGVLPQLEERHAGIWRFAPRLTPGAHPMRELAAAVAAASGKAEQAPDIERQLAARPAEALDQLATLCSKQPLVLFIDQFEEFLTLVRDASQQSAFAQALCSLTEPSALADGFCCRTLLTLRTDHLARFERNHVLKDLYRKFVGADNQIYLQDIAPEDIKRAIQGPADAVGLRFIPAVLIDRLSSETAALSNGLPLLQFALRRLWETRPTNSDGEPLDLVTEEMVNRLPDVKRALSEVASGIYDDFSEPQQRACERLLLELVVLDESFEEPLRRRRREAEITQVLEEHFPTPGDVGKVIEDFVSAGLLRRFGEGSDSWLEVAHEALLRHWGQIYQLLTGADAKERLHLVRQIGREAADWTAHRESKDYLNLRGERLARASAYAEEGWLAEAEAAAYVHACQTQEEEERLEKQRAREEKERADHARELAMAAEAELDHNSQRSLLLAIEAAKTAKSTMLPEVERALRSAIRAARVTGLFRSYGKSGPTAAAFSPDGSTLAVGDSMGGVNHWNVATGRQKKALFAHVDSVGCLGFSPDGSRMASGSDDGRVVLWDTGSARPLHVLAGHVDEVTDVAFSRPAGRLLATASADASIRLWNVATGEPVGKPMYGHTRGVVALAFGRDQRQLVSTSGDRLVVVWDALKATVLYSFVAGSSPFDLDLSADGSLLAVASQDMVEIWDTATRSRRFTLTEHTNSVAFVCFAADDRHIATASYDSTIRVWRLPLADQDQQQEVKAVGVIRLDSTSDMKDRFFTGLALSPRGDTVAASFVGGTATIWSIAGGGELLTLHGYETPVEAVAFSPDQQSIAAASMAGGPVRIWDLSGRRQECDFQDELPPHKAVAFSASGAFAISSGKNVLVAQPSADEPRLRLEGHNQLVNDLAFSPDGLRLVSASHDMTAIVWELPSGKRLKTLKAHTDRVIAVRYSPDGRAIATGGKDGKIVLWQADTFEPQRVIEEHLLGILALAFTPDGERLVSGSKDQTVRVWNTATGEQLAAFGEHTNVVNAVAIHGDRLATAADDGIRLWDLETLRPTPVFPTRSHGAHSLAFSPDGAYLAAGARDGVVRIYAMHRKELIELANKRVHRGLTPEECQWFLHSKTVPRTPYSILDEAYQSFAEFDFETGEQLLREAKGGTDADAGEIDAEMNARLGMFMLWGAGSTITDPDSWKGTFEGQDLGQVAQTLVLAAAEKLGESSFDAPSRLRDISLYRLIESARQLARAGKSKEAIELLAAARDQGWAMLEPPERAASQLYCVQMLTSVWDAGPARDAEEIRARADAVIAALARFPDMRSGHRVAAFLYESVNDYEGAEKQYLKEAAAHERSAEPLASVAWLAVMERDRRQEDDFASKAVEYAERALKRDPGSDKAWYALASAQLALNEYEAAVDSFDQVSPSSQLFAAALNTAGSICFERLKDDKAAYQRFTRAVQLAPNEMRVLTNYAEFLLALGRPEQARLAAARARENPEARTSAGAHVRAAMSFVVFAADVVSGDRDGALAGLGELETDVKEATDALEAAIATGEPLDQWSYQGIRRSLEARSDAFSSWQNSALLGALTFVDTKGKKDTLGEVRRLLHSQAAEETIE